MNIDKTLSEQEVLKRVSLVGDVIVFVKHLEGTTGFVLYVRVGAEEKISALTDLLKPASVEPIFVRYRPITKRINVSDLKIMKSLLSDPRMPIDRVAKEVLLSSKTVRRRLEMMIESQIMEFSILTNLSSMQLTGYVEFAVLIHVNIFLY